VLWCMLFDDDIVLIDDIRICVNAKLELWRQMLESKGFRVSRSKIEYLEYKFSTDRSTNQSVTSNDSVIPVDDYF
jgi:hypothetical protein